ncbi:hypothetical protein [Microcoleus sp. herbarium2]|uniref:hypothetical protein n=1 Tax=Microcoleus sp. herbarium2 TaxID=3055433 RepID=UPI002FD3968A
MKILLDTHIFVWFILFKEIAVLYRQAVRLLRQVNADEERVILTFDRDAGKLIYCWRLRCQEVSFICGFVLTRPKNQHQYS